MKTPIRKSDHVRICLKKPVEFEKTNGFERIELVHKSTPEINFNEIDIRTRFLGKTFSAPLFICGMTGGFKGSENINQNLARAAQELGIGMGLGSQRAGIENPNLWFTYQVREKAPDILLLGDIGAAQILEYDLDRIREIVKVIRADALAIHLNPAQEIVQSEGDSNWAGVLEKIRNICSGVDFPVVVKETGCGMSGEVAKDLADTGVDAIDIAGAGGTSWAKIEYYRGNKMAKNFFEWGIPTALSLEQCVKSVSIPIIASGGIRNGLEVAKSLVMGASLAGLALPLLKPAMKSWIDVKKKLEKIILELKMTMFLVGARNLKELRNTKYLRL